MDPSLAAVSEEARAIILGDCYEMLNATKWGTKLDLAVKYLAAHTGALTLRGAAAGSVGPVSSESLGDAARSYAVAAVSEAQNDLDATIWGRRYKMLCRAYLAFAFAI